jgi:NAD(P)-dependent dehydrogenase (short-subunit alcohol dehydrogenase family)
VVHRGLSGTNRSDLDLRTAASRGRARPGSRRILYYYYYYYYYYWQLPDPSVWTRLSAWAGYALHQLSAWALIYYAQRHVRRYVNGLHPINVIALAVNLIFILLHVVQSQLFYDGLAQDVSIYSSQGSVILLLVVVLLMESRRRGLVLGRGHLDAEACLEICDLTSAESIRGFAAKLGAEERPVDALIHNAGVLRPPVERQLTASGIEVTLATNALGPALLTTALLPALAAAPSSRVLISTSRLHQPGSRGMPVDFDFDDPNLEHGYDQDRLIRIPSWLQSGWRVSWTGACRRRSPATQSVLALSLAPPRRTPPVGNVYCCDTYCPDSHSPELSMKPPQL